MKDPRFADSVLALAGIFQAASLVQQVAREGDPEPAAFQASMASVLLLDAAATAQVYGGPAGVRLGLQVLDSELRGGHAARQREVTAYVIGLMHLERRLSRRPDLIETIAAGVREAAAEGRGSSPTAAAVVARLADLYLETLSTIPPRILVRGEPSRLQNPMVASRIRALLLAGLRSAVLWRQNGGGRLRLLLRRRQVLLVAQRWRDLADED
jgi:high frequency lysogenization protein